MVVQTFSTCAHDAEVGEFQVQAKTGLCSEILSQKHIQKANCSLLLLWPHCLHFFLLTCCLPVGLFLIFKFMLLKIRTCRVIVCCLKDPAFQIFARLAPPASKVTLRRPSVIVQLEVTSVIFTVLAILINISKLMMCHLFS